MSFPRLAFKALLAVALLIQFVPYGHKHVNPPTQAEPPWDSPRTRELFTRACADCHSNNTVWPWYSHVAPVSWLVVRDVEEARRRFNVSEWGRARNNAEGAAYEVQQGFMPLGKYLPLHPAARLNPTEKAELIQGLKKTFPEAPEGDDAGGAPEGGHEASAPADTAAGH